MKNSNDYTKFAVTGKIDFRVEPNKPPTIILISPCSICEISMGNVQITKYRPIGHVNVLCDKFSGENSKKNGIRIAFPAFETFEKDDTFLDDATWTILKTDYDKDFTSVTFGLTHDVATSVDFPYKYFLQYTVSVGPCLSLELSIRNMDSREFAYNDGILAALKIATLEDLQLVGLKKHFHDKTVEFNEQLNLCVPISEEGETVKLVDEMIEREIAIVAEDSKAMIVGSSKKEFPVVIFGAANPKNEKFPPVILKPDEVHITTLRLQAKLM